MSAPPSVHATSSSAKEPRFVCYICAFHSHVDARGNRAPWAPTLAFLEESACLIADPTAADGFPIFIGADCSNCFKSVCPQCSVFYTKRLCLECGKKIAEYLPSEIQKELEKKWKQT
eukprot:tig00021348_g20594.t1